MKRALDRNEKGHAMIELALCAGIMVACLSGIYQFGYSFYIYDELVSAVGNGARYAASRTYRSATDADLKKGTEAIQNMVVFGDSRPAPNAVPIAPNLKPENIQVTWVKGDGNGNNSSPVAVDVAIVHYSVGAMFGSFSLDHRPFAEFPYIGRYAPSETEP